CSRAAGGGEETSGSVQPRCARGSRLRRRGVETVPHLLRAHEIVPGQLARRVLAIAEGVWKRFHTPSRLRTKGAASFPHRFCEAEIAPSNASAPLLRCREEATQAFHTLPTVFRPLRARR